METSDKIQICKVIAQAILADVQITDEERAFLDKLMDRYELDFEQRKDVLARNMDDDPVEIAKEISSMESKDELLKELIDAVRVDGEIAPAEIKLVERVGTAIDVSPEEVKMLFED